MKKQVHALFSGRVQGVGFRYTVLDIAGNLKVSGWVKNLRDGRVELLAEAEENTLQDFLSQVNQYFSNYIQDVDTKWQESEGKLKDFQIEY